MPLNPSSLLNNFNPAAASAASEQLRSLASQSPAGLVDQLGGQNFLDGMPSNLVSQLTPLLSQLAPADLLAAVNTAAGAMQNPAQLQQLLNSLPATGGLPTGGELARMVQNNIPAFLADQLPNLGPLTQAAGLPAVPPMPNLAGLPTQAAGLINDLRGQAPALYQQALSQIPVPPVPRVLPEHIPLPDPQDLTPAAHSCAQAAGQSREELVKQALELAPPLPPEVAQAMGGASEVADTFVAGMSDVASQLNQTPNSLQEAAGMMSLLGGPANAPINEVTQGLQGLNDAYNALAPEGAPSMQDLASAGEQLQRAAEQIPPDALAALF